MKNHLGKLLAIALGLVASAAVAQTTAPPPGRLLASNCFGCHGTNGNSVSGIDRISGESAQEIYKEMVEMRAKPPRSNIMHPHARAYTDQQLWLIADYLSRQPRTSR